MTIGVVSIGFQLITFSILAYYMVIPLGQRAADDLASVITHAAETWENLSTAERKVFADKIRSKHDLLLTTNDTHLSGSTSFLPYLLFLESALNKQLGGEVQIKESVTEESGLWFWADIPVSDATLRVGFSRSRIGVNPPIAFFMLMVIGIYLTFITAVILTRRLTVPIDRLYHAAQAVGKGHWPDSIEVDGPEELAVLTREFNRMNVQVRELLSNRTTLLAGIAHDLRTPLTQIQLALSMLPNEGGSPELMKSINEDLGVINRLIGETLSISLELEEEQNVPTDIALVLDDLTGSVQADGAEINLACSKLQYQVDHPLALHRILTNLLVNAIRYGEGKSIDIVCEYSKGNIVIQIMDRGPGIPSEQLASVFRPFYRLEKSRGSGTGGTGLGLAIVKQLADANKWKIELVRRSGGGTSAVLTLPHCIIE